jgi:adenylate cyclase
MFFYHKELERGKRIQFAQMKQLNLQKEEIRQTFSKYMGGTVADSILSDDINTHGEDRWVTVLFTDLRGYSTISEPMSPKEVLSMLNEYFSEMVPIVEKYEGVVLEYIGDAMMIVFGAPKNVEMHQEKAVRCAMEMREHLKVLNEKWNERDLSRYWQNQDIETLDARAGIHTGNVVAGNIGGDRVMKYGAIGDVVNIAARLEQANKSIGSDILFSRSVYVALTRGLIEQCKDQGTMALKGRSGEERVYSV